jgi:hypothetical protein
VVILDSSVCARSKNELVISLAIALRNEGERQLRFRKTQAKPSLGEQPEQISPLKPAAQLLFFEPQRHYCSGFVPLLPLEMK